MAVFSSVGFLSAITTTGNSWTNSKMSRWRAHLLSTTVCWSTECQTLAPHSSISIAQTWARRTRPSSVRYPESAPPSPFDERCDYESQVAVLSGRVSLPKASSSNSRKRSGLGAARARRSRHRSTTSSEYAVTLRTGCIQGEIRAASDTPAATFEPGECSVFDLPLRLRMHEPRLLIIVTNAMPRYAASTPPTSGCTAQLSRQISCI